MLVFSRQAVRRLDAAAESELLIPGLLLMENAAFSLEHAALRLLPTPVAGAAVLILCGPGNNGGDGFALARRLANLGATTTIALAFDPARARGDALTNLRIAQAIGIPTLPLTSDASPLDSLPAPALVVDALLGTGADKPPTGLIAHAVRWINHARDAGARVLAVDIPTGLDCDTGLPLGEDTVRAHATLTLAGMKPGLLLHHARPYTGDVHVGDIGLPPAFLRRFADSGLQPR